MIKNLLLSIAVVFAGLAVLTIVASLQATARRGFINKLKSELQLDKVICDIEKWSQDDFMKEIIETVENWRDYQVRRSK